MDEDRIAELRADFDALEQASAILSSHTSNADINDILGKIEMASQEIEEEIEQLETEMSEEDDDELENAGPGW